MDRTELQPYEAFVMDIVSYLVDDYDNISITSKIDERGIFMEVSVPGSQLGRLIGKKGATVEALRTLLRCYGQRKDQRLSLKLLEI